MSYETVFTLTNKSIYAKEVAIQDGVSLQTALTAVLSSSLASSVTGTTVQSVTILTNSACKAAGLIAPCAAIDYTVLGPNGQVLVPNSTGYAVEEHGNWLVSKTTVCGFFYLLVQAVGISGEVPGCPT